MSKTEKTDDGYGISYLAEQLDMDPSNVRNALRRLKVEKTDNRYSWSRKSEADAVVKRIKDNKREQPEALKKGKSEKADGAKTPKAAKVNKDASDRAKASAKDAKAAKGKDAKKAPKAKAKAKDADEE